MVRHFLYLKWPSGLDLSLGGWEDFFSFVGGGGNHVVFRWIVRGIMISRRLQSIWVGTIENWQSIYCQWRGGGRAGVVAVTRILQRFMGRSGKFGNIVTQPNPPPPPPRKHGDKWLVQRREPFIREKLLLSFREYLSTFSTDLFETQKMNFNFYLPGYEQWFKVCVPDRNYGVVFIFIFLDALGPYQHVFLIQFYFCFTPWKIDKICRFIKQSTFCR